MDAMFAEQDSLFRRTAMFANILNDVLSQKRDSSQSDLCKMKKKEGRRRAKPIDRTNITAEELEYQRLLNEIKEAEEYELVVERDSNSNLCKDGYGKAYSKEEQENEVAKENFDKSKHSNDLSLEKSRIVNQLDITGSPLIFIVHPSEPTTSTPLQATRSTCKSRLHQDMFKFDHDTQLSPIINKEDIVCDGSGRAASKTCLRFDGNDEVKRKSDIETIDCHQSASEARILTTLQESSPQLTILNSPGHWGFRNEEYEYENVTTSEHGNRPITILIYN
ncbi:unnamed protein product [Onchocerca flexuosa]|uniref:Protein BREAKING OF ASYMMETRY IN THE STOMATAL LINEAGE n=1 Tax=Onchocerca flexuosa TaxID=387005 RepID=A0A183HBI4_9BILA|nr:unnamed protein product [Onchocerca flexuosa]